MSKRDREPTDEQRRSEERYRALVDGIPDAIIHVRADGMVLGFKPGKGFPGGDRPADCKGKNVREVFPWIARETLERAERARRTGETEEWAFQLPIDGKTAAFEARVVAFQDREAFVIVRDVTERTRLEERLLQAQRMEAVGRLARGVAHDFNNILTLIKGYTELMLGRLPADDPIRPHAEQVRRAADRAAALTGELLAFGRRRMFEPRDFDLNAVVTNLEKMLRRLIGEDVVLDTSLAASLDPVRADPAQIEHCILNLALDAREAMPHGGRLLIETGAFDADEAFARRHAGLVPGRWALLSVTDQGRAMDAPTGSRVFDPSSTTPGTGPGLATVRGIVSQAGGHVLCDSEAGRGRRFRILLPFAKAPREPAAPAAAPAPAAVRGSETVLLVEDEEAVRDLVREVLTASGYRVLVAQDPRDIERVWRERAGEIDLLLTDVVLPHLSGPEIAERLSGANAKLKILYMSGYPVDSIASRGVLEPGTHFLQKPFAVEALTRKVRAVLDSK